jgi:hypothetical protein
LLPVHAYINTGVNDMASPNPVNGIGDASSRGSGETALRTVEAQAAMRRDVDLSQLTVDSGDDNEVSGGSSCGAATSSPGSSSCPASTDGGVSSCSGLGISSLAQANVAASSKNKQKDEDDQSDEAAASTSNAVEADLLDEDDAEGWDLSEDQGNTVASGAVLRQAGELIIDFSGKQAALAAGN